MLMIKHFYAEFIFTQILFPAILEQVFFSQVFFSFFQNRLNMKRYFLSKTHSEPEYHKGMGEDTSKVGIRDIWNF